MGLQNTIVAGNSLPSCQGTVLDGHDIAFPDAACPGASVDPRLGPLANNGGPTKTQKLDPGSSAIDAVPAAGAACVPADQRGVGRPQGAGCDIGAYEHAPPAISTGAAAGVSATAATLSGQINSNAQTAGYHFEYGTTVAYGSSSAPQQVGPGLAPVAVTGGVSGLTPATTYHYRLVASNLDGTALGTDQSFTTPGGASGSAGAPRFLSASVRPRVFAVQRGGGARKHGAPRGTTFRYALSQSARVVFTIEPVLPGRRAGRACPAQTAHNRNLRACTRFGKPRRLTAGAIAGSNLTRFTGLIGGVALAPGRYRVTLVATDAVGRRSAPTRLSFRVVLG